MARAAPAARAALAAPGALAVSAARRRARTPRASAGTGTRSCAIAPFACYAPAERDATFAGNFGGSIQECNTTKNQTCGIVALFCTIYSPTAGNACVTKTIAVTCTAFKADQMPAECDAICP